MQSTADRRNADREALESCAGAVARKYRQGLPADLGRTGLPMAWRGLLRSLSACCPGFTEIEYGIALNQALTASRPAPPFPESTP